MSMSELITLLIAATCLAAFGVIVVHTFLSTRSVKAVNERLVEFRADPRWMDTVEAGILKTVPTEVVLDMNKRFDMLITLLASFGTPEQKQLAATMQEMVGALTDGKPNTPPAGAAE